MRNDIADRIALMDVMSRYASGLDDGDMEMYAACFLDDVIVYPGSADPVSGLENWLAYVRERLRAYGATQHMLGPQLATIEGDIAQCRTDVQATHFYKDDMTKTMTLWATYRTEMRRLDGAWKIKTHRLVRRGTRVQQG
jgi:3-phenylpropionate/cinnamic acid dioxygenase small subunit